MIAAIDCASGCGANSSWPSPARFFKMPGEVCLDYPALLCWLLDTLDYDSYFLPVRLCFHRS